MTEATPALPAVEVADSVSNIPLIARCTGAPPLRVIGDRPRDGLVVAIWQSGDLDAIVDGVTHHAVVCLKAGSPSVTRIAEGCRIHKRAKAGSMFFVSADLPANWRKEGRSETVEVYFAPDILRDFAEQHLSGASVPRTADFFGIEDRWLEGYFRMLVSEYDVLSPARGPADTLLLDQTQHLLIRHLVRRHSSMGNHDRAALERADHANPLRPVLLRRVQDYIDGNLGDDIRLGTLAGLAHMSIDHFARAFRAATGETPYRYVLEQRLRRAAGMLADNAAPVQAIAAACGFRNPAHFSTRFASRFGVSPSQYRRCCRSDR